MNKFFHMLICLVPMASTAQTGTWNIVNLKVNTSQHLNFFGEAQLRSLKTYTHFHYYEFKTGISFLSKKNLSLTTGMGTVDNNYNKHVNAYQKEER